MTGNDLAKFIEEQLTIADRWVSGTADLGELHIASILVLAWLGIIMIVLVGTFTWLIWNERETPPNSEPKDRLIGIIRGTMGLLRHTIFMLIYFSGAAILFTAWLVIAEIAGTINEELELVALVVSGIPMIYLAYHYYTLLERCFFRNSEKLD